MAPTVSRNRNRSALVAVVLAAITASCLAGSATALAGPPGRWTRVTWEPQPSNTREIGLERTADGVLHVLWTRDTGSTDQVLHSAIPLNAKGALGPNLVVSTPDGLNSSVDLVAGPGGGLRAFFSGLFPGSPLPGGYDDVMATATSSAAGTSWSPPAPASNNQLGTSSPVYAAAGIGAAVSAGLPISTWGDAGPGDGGVHFGISGLGPDLPFSGGCCHIDPNVAVDSVTGDVVLASTFLGSSETYLRVAGTVPPQIAPGSGASWLGQRIGITGRIGAPGVYAAYGHGTNEFSARPALWRVGASRAKVLRTRRDAQQTTIAPAPGGRLWVVWEGADRGHRLFATRTNPAATRFGRIVSVKPPAGTRVVYRLNAEGSRGPLDLLALVERGGNDIGYWHQRLRAGLTLLARPRRVRAGRRITFRVLDAGSPVKGARVVLRLGKRRRVRRTNATGRARIRIPRRTRPRRYLAWARKPGYAVARRRIRVRR